MNGTKTVLNAVHKGTQMGLRSLDNIMDTVEDAKMRAHLREEHAQYAEIHERAAALLAQQEEKPDSIGPMAKMASDMSAKMNTLIDKTSSHIAEMMMQGNMMGVIEITKTMKNNPDADAGALKLAQDLLQTQENNIRKLKQFL